MTIFNAVISEELMMDVQCRRPFTQLQSSIFSKSLVNRYCRSRNILITSKPSLSNSIFYNCNDFQRQAEVSCISWVWMEVPVGIICLAHNCPRTLSRNASQVRNTKIGCKRMKLKHLVLIVSMRK